MNETTVSNHVESGTLATTRNESSGAPSRFTTRPRAVTRSRVARSLVMPTVGASAHAERTIASVTCAGVRPAVFLDGIVIERTISDCGNSNAPLRKPYAWMDANAIVEERDLRKASHRRGVIPHIVRRRIQPVEPLLHAEYAERGCQHHRRRPRTDRVQLLEKPFKSIGKRSPWSEFP